MYGFFTGTASPGGFEVAGFFDRPTGDVTMLILRPSPRVFAGWITADLQTITLTGGTFVRQ